MRHLIGLDQDLNRIIKDHSLAKHYKFILKLIMDNDTTQTGAFSIQNIAKMGYCHNKLPGEWYGPHAISIMLRVINLCSLTLFLRILTKYINPVKTFKYVCFTTAIYTMTRSGS